MSFLKHLIKTPRYTPLVKSCLKKRLHTQVPKASTANAAIKEDFSLSHSKLDDFSVLHSSYYNIGTALSHNSRQKLNLTGQIPSTIENLSQQSSRALKFLRSKSSSLDKYVFMSQLRNTNTILFYKLVNDHIEEIAPIIYTPTVGEACQNYSDIYPFLSGPGSSDGLYITLNDIPHLDEILASYQQRNGDVLPDIAVVTDGSRILGLGDLGMNGMPISQGKLQLYVAGAGIDPRRTLPIVLDFGTDNPRYLNDPSYLGLRQKRPDDSVFYTAVDQVLTSLTETFPQLLVQFEDFSSQHAFGLLHKYQNKIRCFNDDIQGTGAVILSGLINAFRKVEEESNVELKQHRLLFYGAGSAAIGVARQIQDYLMLEKGLTEEEARAMFYICDSKGLVTLDRGDKLAEHKVYYARKEGNSQKQNRALVDIIQHVKPTTLIGLSSSPGSFDGPVLKAMQHCNKQPIVFPLSNPATQAECTFKDAMKGTDNTVVFASGTAFSPFKDENGISRVPGGQGNNMYVFPGLGLGCILARPTRVTDRMILRAAIALADTLSEEERQRGLLYPELTRIREVSAVVASEVVDQIVKDGLATDDQIISSHPNNYLDYVKSTMWSPTYSEI